jgi:hypothetical protein
LRIRKAGKTNKVFIFSNNLKNKGLLTNCYKVVNAANIEATYANSRDTLKLSQFTEQSILQMKIEYFIDNTLQCYLSRYSRRLNPERRKTTYYDLNYTLVVGTLILRHLACYQHGITIPQSNRNISVTESDL